MSGQSGTAALMSQVCRAGAGLEATRTHLVPDLPMRQVFLHLESLECSLLHHTLQESMHRPLAELCSLALPTPASGSNICLKTLESVILCLCGDRKNSPVFFLSMQSLCNSSWF